MLLNNPHDKRSDQATAGRKKLRLAERMATWRTMMGCIWREEAAALPSAAPKLRRLVFMSRNCSEAGVYDSAQRTLGLAPGNCRAGVARALARRKQGAEKQA